jgi:hypothetical protein
MPSARPGSGVTRNLPRWVSWSRSDIWNGNYLHAMVDCAISTAHAQSRRIAHLPHVRQRSQPCSGTEAHVHLQAHVSTALVCAAASASFLHAGTGRVRRREHAAFCAFKRRRRKHPFVGRFERRSAAQRVVRTCKGSCGVEFARAEGLLAAWWDWGSATFDETSSFLTDQQRAFAREQVRRWRMRMPEDQRPGS